MRDSSRGMIEIYDCEKQNDFYFSIIKLVWNSENFTLRFGIVEQDYFNLRNIISFRPFENTAVGPYRYLFSGSYSKNNPTAGISKMSIRVEQQKMGKQYDFQTSNAYVSNLLWFGEINERSIFDGFRISNHDNAESVKNA